jgi:predicted ATPase
VGKTTLLKRLAEEPAIRQFRPESELARGVIEEKQLQRADFDPEEHPNVFETLQVAIINRQNEVEERNTEKGDHYIMDRGIDPVVYVRYYLNEEAYRCLLAMPSTQQMVQRYRSVASYIFVITPNRECIKDDGVRLQPKLEDLQKFTQCMKKTLRENAIRFHEIDVLDIEERVKRVVEKLTDP